MKNQPTKIVDGVVIFSADFLSEKAEKKQILLDRRAQLHAQQILSARINPPAENEKDPVYAERQQCPFCSQGLREGLLKSFPKELPPLVRRQWSEDDLQRLSSLSEKHPGQESLDERANEQAPQTLPAAQQSFHPDSQV
ncbi:hypothetical protein [Paludibacterium denitrificans]|uniref:Uncharacterized protein n=1 Tax=Paludibacterium denitrificans TaxID=2675226 RepID=A0A844GH38_9NEIS|nr:hypothetical protein [Paludibacterium denitrificans]MTD33984.1 hypothetical protein [Paludibacterium denitrificans]